MCVLNTFVAMSVLNVIMWLWVCDNGGNMVETEQGDHHKKQLTELGSKKKKLNRN